MVLRTIPFVVRALALGLAILVAVPASGLGQLVYFCTMTGEVGPKCGCQHEVDLEHAGHPSVSTAPCCEIVSSEQHVPPTRVEVHTLQFETPNLVTLRFQPSHRTLGRVPMDLAVPHGPRGPPPDTGPPIFIRHCSYLI